MKTNVHFKQWKKLHLCLYDKGNNDKLNIKVLKDAKKRRGWSTKDLKWYFAACLV